MSLTLIMSSFFAGILTIFSPCILPMVPFVAKSAMQKSKWGPVFLSLGIAISFSVSTYIIATSGQLLGLSPDGLKLMSGIFLLIASVLFIFPVLIDKLSLMLSPLNNKIQTINYSNNKSFAIGEFVNGLLLGPIWAPCSGPTLAVIIGIIINTPEVKSSMLLLAIFSVGSILPILFISYGAKSLISRIQKKSLENSDLTKKVLGAFCGVMSILILTGLDKRVETALLKIIPDFITNISLSI